MFGEVLFANVKKLIPRVSATELIALRSGTTCMDREIFQGKVQYPSKESSQKWKNYEKKFSEKIIDELLHKYGNNETIYPGKKTLKIQIILKMWMVFVH